MPGIDFDRVRREITMEEVLNLLGFAPWKRSGTSGTDAVRCTNPSLAEVARFP